LNLNRKCFNGALKTWAISNLQWKVSDARRSGKAVEWNGEWRLVAARQQPAAGMKTNAHHPNRKWLGAKCFVQFNDLVAGFGFQNAISTVAWFLVHCFDLGKGQSLFFLNFSYTLHCKLQN
jgi:hypothetical protein